jgi:acyl-CoA thioesterase-2
MSKVLDDLVKLLALEPIEQNLFRGQSQDLGWGTVFGGQVLGQALSAAVQTVPAERHVHSFNSYFLRPGDVSLPIVYEVDRIRDGSSFTTRRVVAIQKGQAIFNLAASFQVDEEGFEHQDAMPEHGEPESFPTDQERAVSFADKLPPPMRERALGERPFEFRPVDPVDDPIHPSPRPPSRSLWLRAAGRLPDQPSLHRYLLAYASDYSFMTTSLLPHGVGWMTPGMQVASLDHVMYFHRPFRVDDWLLYVMDSPTASGARGLARGRIFNAEGLLVASCVQEGLIRKRSVR